jgi:hypothetical protein
MKGRPSGERAKVGSSRRVRLLQRISALSFSSPALAMLALRRNPLR